MRTRRTGRVVAVVVAIVGWLITVPGSPPAAAAHDSPAGSGWPCSPGLQLPCVVVGAAGAVHEEMPDLAVVSPAVPCMLTGTFAAVAPAAVGGPDHAPSVPNVNSSPSHSHFAFAALVATCGTTGHLATATGGNDGHIVDVLDPALPLGGPNGDVVEADPLDDCFQPGDPDGGPCGFDDGGVGDDHDFNDHHGSVNESGWSHSSGYVGGAGGGESNACGPPGFDVGGANQNKGELIVDGVSGWMKYLRVGTVIYLWGCNFALGGANDFLSGSVAALPIPTVPGTFVLSGTVASGPGWLNDFEPGS